MAWDFPTPTTVGQQFSPTPGVTYSWNGTAWDLVTQGNVLASGVVQQVYAENTTPQTFTTTIAGGNDTVPQQTDGTQIVTATITPKTIGNILRFDFVVPITGGAQFGIWTALFQDSTAAALASIWTSVPVSEYFSATPFNFETPVNTISPTTFKIRIGNTSGNANSIRTLADSSSRRGGGSQRVVLIITEISPLISPSPTFTSGNVLLATRVANNQATVDFLSLMDGTYDEYEVHFFDMQLTTNSDYLAVRIGEGGTILTASNYAYEGYVANSSVFGASSQPLIALCTGTIYNSANYPVSGRVKIAKPSASGITKNLNWEITYWNQTLGGPGDSRGSGMWTGDFNPIDSLRFFAGAGTNLVTGTFKLYGVR